MLCSCVWGLTPYKKHYFSLLSQNDGYIFPMIDKYYTAGNSLLYASPEGDYGKLNSFGFLSGETSFALSLSQNIYTPKAKFAIFPPKDDHPYAGYLNLAFIITHRQENWLENLGVKVGVTGEYSFAKEAQDGIHTMLDVGLANGWKTQSNNEFMLNFHYDLIYKHNLFESDYFGIDLLPNIESAFGNANVYLAGGGTLRMGYHLSSTFLSQGIAGENGGLNTGRVYADGLGIFGFIGAKGMLVLCNAFIEGNIFATSKNYYDVDLFPLVGKVEAGVSIVSGVLNATFKAIYTTKEFLQQDGAHWVGSLSLAISF